MSTLRDKFLTWLVESGSETFRTKDALWWYQQNKQSPTRADYSNLYVLILHPLLRQGAIEKHEHGLWSLRRAVKDEVLKPDPDVELDPFDEYIQQKLKGD